MNNLSYEELCEKLQNGEIGYLEFVISQEDLEALYANSMKINGLPQNDATAQGWLEHYEENLLKDDATAEDVLPTL
jgi:hypothetical protein